MEKPERYRIKNGSQYEYDSPSRHGYIQHRIDGPQEIRQHADGATTDYDFVIDSNFIGYVVFDHSTQKVVEVTIFLRSM
jgi:hypothetical protein